MKEAIRNLFKKRWTVLIILLGVCFFVALFAAETIFVAGTLTFNPEAGSRLRQLAAGLSQLPAHLQLPLFRLPESKVPSSQPPHRSTSPQPELILPPGEVPPPNYTNPDVPTAFPTQNVPQPTQWIAPTRIPQPTAPGPRDPAQLASCLTQKGYTMYGIQNCSACQAQQNFFGGSFSLIHAVDCNSQKSTCQEKGIRAYPTWEDGGGQKYRGAMRLETLARISGCPY